MLNEKLSEEYIIALLKTDPDKGIELIYDQYHEILNKKAFALLKNKQEAEDVVQELLISI